MIHRPCLIYPDQHQCGVSVYYFFFGFPWYKNLYICISFSKSICSIKAYWWSLILSWPDEVQKMFSTAHELLNVKLIPQTIFMNFYKIDMTFTLLCFIYYVRYLTQAPRLLSYEVSLFIYIHHSFSFFIEL